MGYLLKIAFAFVPSGAETIRGPRKLHGPPKRQIVVCVKYGYETSVKKKNRRGGGAINVAVAQS